MSRRWKFACGVFYGVAVWAALVFVVDVVVSESAMARLPWKTSHLAVVSEPDGARIVSIFLDFLGGLMLAVGISLGLLVHGPLRKDERWARPVVIVLSLGVLLPQLVAWVRLGNPVPAIGIVCGWIVLVSIAGYIVIREPTRNDP